MENTTSLLRRVGDQFDRGIMPRVGNGGVVLPEGPAGTHAKSGLEKEDDYAERAKKCGNSGPRAGSASRSANHPARRDRAPSQTASAIRPNVQASYEEGLTTVIQGAYPGASSWRQGHGLWIVAESELLKGLGQRAVFVVGVALRYQLVRSWGFWRTLGSLLSWIGPRHTNCPDGSICAFDPSEGTWAVGDPLIELLDLYTLWAVRHAYLARFGRWPGEQLAPFPCERVVEQAADEFCGCASGHRYGECCWTGDRGRNRLADAFTYLRTFGERKPPEELIRFANGRTDPPPVEDAVVGWALPD